MKNLTGFSLVLIFISIFAFNFSKNSQAASFENATINGVPVEMKCGGGSYPFYPNMNLQLDIVSDNPDATYITMLPPSVGANFIQVVPSALLRYHLSWDSIPIGELYFIRFEIRNQLGDRLETCDIVFDDPFLPINLASFTSTIYRDNINLDWTTTSETNNAWFEIERTCANNNMAENWNKIGTVEGSGTISTNKSYSFTDKGLNSGRYKYRLKQIDFNGNCEYHSLSNEVIIAVPERFELSQNYPNPFNPTTNIDFNLPLDANVCISVYDISGKMVSTILKNYLPGGYYKVKFEANNLSGGVYFYRLETDEYSETRKLVLLK